MVFPVKVHTEQRKIAWLFIKKSHTSRMPDGPHYYGEMP